MATDRPVTLGEVLGAHDGARVAKYKWPGRLEGVDELPRSNIGKLDKKSLRRRIAVAAD